MILSNVEIIRCLKEGYFSIKDLQQNNNPSKAPFNTSAVDLRLGDEIVIPESKLPTQIDMCKGGIAAYLKNNSRKLTIQKDHPYSLKKNQFILAKTMEVVDFPLQLEKEISYSARVEGKSSLARCGILVHFTAPTIHAGFKGTITLEIINLGFDDFLLTPEMAICQLIIEEVKGCPSNAPNQFKGQLDSVGKI